MVASLLAQIYKRPLLSLSCHAHLETADMLGALRRSSEHKGRLDAFLEEVMEVADRFEVRNRRAAGDLDHLSLE